MQDLLAILIAAIAAGFLAYRGWAHFARKRGSACESCAGSCSSGTPTPLVTILPDMSHAETQKRRA